MQSLLCFSHLRWDFVYQRPQHLISRFAQHRPVFYFEEPVFGAQANYLEVSVRGLNLKIVTPHLRNGLPAAEVNEIQRNLLDEWIEKEMKDDFDLWYYTPMAYAFSNHLESPVIVYDCMDELSAFLHAPPELKFLEDELLRRADIVFTGGNSLYNLKKQKHSNVFFFPSSIDKKHFQQARKINIQPEDQAVIQGRKAGYAGVIDERMDLDLLKAAAINCPDWQFIMIGPVVKINQDALPRLPNIHYLGMKDYDELPAYMSGWEYGLLPFALNDSTRFISPTKTPEYLAAGLRVISTPVRDVVNTYHGKDLISIADSSAELCENLYQVYTEEQAIAWRKRVDDFLDENSWDATWKQMNQLMHKTFKYKPVKTEQYEV
jgi:UDP-galactopyranose mutase